MREASELFHPNSDVLGERHLFGDRSSRFEALLDLKLCFSSLGFSSVSFLIPFVII